MEELFDGLLNDHLGFVVWSTVAFIILLVLLGKFAWKPIMAAIGERERFIEDALLKAEAAKQEMALLTAENESLMKQARAERDLILAEAKKLKDQIVNEAKDIANKEGARMIENARLEINNQKAIALADVKNQVATLSIEIAEKILRKQLEDAHKQDELVADLLKEVKLK
ncbi:F0F1 ATP synthase subunit B [Mucilaginibacter myungsuensis]|uniref:ATP synthase subunit b n=1 Tax=Mucilaginibacter myungsuensis TaxID=649104 RepID=A0A929KYF0_9SPHI|nr:F0F1 ATP synthase subunit B [Mucilaginibacter myungsuensis]MBE9663969.1 F0F1 ATP synthase subunit B [Mucilaginibacter myungsuensis]MDN3598315.1 F0F1 ATP synthase subunit B [Mucilaginibacter myungsuensis]